MYRWDSGTLAGGLGCKYVAKAAVWPVCRANAFALPELELRAVAAVAGVRSVCIQCSSVLVCGGLLVGMSRSIISTAYDVPFKRCVVASLGSLAVPVH